MIKNSIYTWMLLFSFGSCFSQSTIDLKLISFQMNMEDFYIDKVMDDRLENSIGRIINRNGEPVDYYLKNTAAESVSSFMNALLPKTEDRKPIDIRIKALKVEKAQSGVESVKARVYVSLYFYTPSGELLYKIGHYESQDYTMSDWLEIKETHELRIRAALEYCVWSFIDNSKNNNSNLVNTENGKLKVENDHVVTFVPLSKWFNMLTFKKMYDKYNEGWEVAYTGFLDSESDLIVPFELAYGQSVAKSDRVRDKGFSSVNSYALGFGVSGYIKLIPGLYADVGVSVPIGMEILRDLNNKKSNNFLIGIGANQGVKIIPWQDFGIVIGAGLFQRFETSKVHNMNVGFELELGINF